MNRKKGQFANRQICFVIGLGGISTDPKKIESILNSPAPRSLKQTRGFLGLAVISAPVLININY